MEIDNGLDPELSIRLRRYDSDRIKGAGEL